MEAVLVRLLILALFGVVVLTTSADRHAFFVLFDRAHFTQC